MSDQPATPPPLPTFAIPAIPSMEILGRAGRITWTYAWALVLAKFVIDIPYSLIDNGIQEPMVAFRFSSFYELFVSGFVSLGIYRCILRLETEGTAPTFAETYSFGVRYYSRNFRMTMLFGCYLIPIALVCLGLLAPALWLNAYHPEHPALPWCSAVGVLVSVVLVFWWLARTSFHNAVLCDEAKGAVDAMDKTLALTKGNVGTLLPICLLLGMIFSFVTSATTSVRGAIDHAIGDLPRVTSSLVDLVLLVPTTCLEVFMIATLALVYLHFRKYARPMPLG